MRFCPLASLFEIHVQYFTASLIDSVERCKHVKSQATTVYFSIGRLGRVSAYVQHSSGIIGHVTVKEGNRVETDGTPPQVPPNSAAAGSEVESVRRPGVAKQAAGG